MSLKSYNYRCLDEDCGYITNHFVTYEDRKTKQICETCGGEATYTIAAPTVLKASYPDGYRAQNDPNWQLVKEKSKLQMERANTSSRKGKAEVKKEITKIKKKNGPL